MAPHQSGLEGDTPSDAKRGADGSRRFAERFEQAANRGSNDDPLQHQWRRRLERSRRSMSTTGDRRRNAETSFVASNLSGYTNIFVASHRHGECIEHCAEQVYETPRERLRRRPEIDPDRRRRRWSLSVTLNLRIYQCRQGGRLFNIKSTGDRRDNFDIIKRPAIRQYGGGRDYNVTLGRRHRHRTRQYDLLSGSAVA